MRAGIHRTLGYLLLAVLLAVLLAGCSSTGLPPLATNPPLSDAPAPSTPATDPSTTPPAAAQLDSLELTTGELILHVGKAGRLARLGHNHLVATEQLTGNAWLDSAGTLQARLSLVVATLSVDDPERRAFYRAQTDASTDWAEVYRSTPSTKNLADTRANMLGSKVLDATNFPVITITATASAAAAELSASTAGSLNTELTMRVRDVDTHLPVTLHWVRLAAGHIRWHSNFALTHTELGLTPFSALGGALSVAQQLNFEVRGVLQRSGKVQAEKSIVGPGQPHASRPPHTRRQSYAL